MNAVGKGERFKSLIEPKQVEVSQFAGSVADNRQTFLKWAEAFKDRVTLFDEKLAKTLTLVEQKTEPITKEMSISMGVTGLASRELNSFLKDKTKGTAEAIVRSNKSEVGLESWRMLCHQYARGIPN